MIEQRLLGPENIPPPDRDVMKANPDLLKVLDASQAAEILKPEAPPIKESSPAAYDFKSLDSIIDGRIDPVTHAVIVNYPRPQTFENMNVILINSKSGSREHFVIQ